MRPRIEEEGKQFPLNSFPFFDLLWVRSATQDITFPALLNCVAVPGRRVWNPGSTLWSVYSVSIVHSLHCLLLAVGEAHFSVVSSKSSC